MMRNENMRKIDWKLQGGWDILVYVYKLLSLKWVMTTNDLFNILYPYRWVKANLQISMSDFSQSSFFWTYEAAHGSDRFRTVLERSS